MPILHRADIKLEIDWAKNGYLPIQVTIPGTTQYNAVASNLTYTQVEPQASSSTSTTEQVDSLGTLDYTQTEPQGTSTTTTTTTNEWVDQYTDYTFLTGWSPWPANALTIVIFNNGAGSLYCYNADQMVFFQPMTDGDQFRVYADADNYIVVTIDAPGTQGGKPHFIYFGSSEYSIATTGSLSNNTPVTIQSFEEVETETTTTTPASYAGIIYDNGNTELRLDPALGVTALQVGETIQMAAGSATVRATVDAITAGTDYTTITISDRATVGTIADDTSSTVSRVYETSNTVVTPADYTGTLYDAGGFIRIDPATDISTINTGDDVRVRQNETNYIDLASVILSSATEYQQLSAAQSTVGAVAEGSTVSLQLAQEVGAVTVQQDVSDVTGDVMNLQLTTGALVDVGLTGIQLTSAFGEAVLYNRDFRYNANGTAAFFPDGQGRTNPARLTCEGVTLWEGVALPAEHHHQPKEVDVATVRLQGALYDSLSNALPAYLNPNASSASIELATMLSAAGVTAGTSYVNDIPTGVVNYQEARLSDVAGEFARFLDGYPYETHDGKLAMVCPRAFAASAITPIDLTLAAQQASGMIVFNESYVQEEIGLVYNRLQTGRQGIVKGARVVDETTGESSIIAGAKETIASVREEAFSGTINRTYSIANIEGAIAAENWEVTDFETGGVGGLFHTIVAQTDTSITVSFTSPQLLTNGFEATVKALISRIEVVEEYTLDYEWSQARYDLREIGTPYWHGVGNTQYAHMAAARRQLNRLQHPLFLARIRLPLWQPTAALSATAAAIRPGSYVDIQSLDSSEGTLLRKPMLVLQCDYQWSGMNAAMPTLTAHAIELPADFDGERWVATAGVPKAGRNTVAS